jgi:hypothetical protein
MDLRDNPESEDSSLEPHNENSSNENREYGDYHTENSASLVSILLQSRNNGSDITKARYHPSGRYSLKLIKTVEHSRLNFD